MNQYADEIWDTLKKLIFKDAIKWESVNDKNKALEVLRLYAIARENQ